VDFATLPADNRPMRFASLIEIDPEPAPIERPT